MEMSSVLQNDGGVDAERNGCLDKWKLCAYAVDRVNDVGAGLAEDDDRNRALAVQIASRTDVSHRVCHLSDVGQADSRAVFIADDQRLVVRGVRDLVVGLDIRSHIAIGDLAFGEIGILQTQNRLDILESKSIAGQLCGIRVHAHRRQRTPSDTDLAYALYLRQLLRDDGGSFVINFIGPVLVGGEAENHDRRICGIDLAIGWIARQVGGQIGSRRIDGGLHIARRAINVAAEVELNGDRCASECAGGGHLRHTCNMTELPLQGRGDGRRHNVGTATRQACTD